MILPEQDVLRHVHLRGLPSSGAVALTFDDGPNGRCTEGVLDALRAVRAPATFFVVGANVAGGANDAVLARMVREGHAIGIHSWSHRVRPLFTRPMIRRELHDTSDVVAAALRRAGIADVPPLRFFRPPFGVVTGATEEAVADTGLEIVEWTVSVEDWRRGQTAAAVRDRILGVVRSGDVIVLHDGNGAHQDSRARCTDRPIVAETVRLLVPALDARGLRVAPLAEVLGLEVPHSSLTPPATDH